MKVFAGVAALEAASGQHLGYSDWFTITQERIDCFAKATGDCQWIHTDPERAVVGPFGSTVAHGFLTLALIPLLSNQVYAVTGLQMAVNYGSDRVRYVAPVPVDSRIRAGVELLSVARSDQGARAITRVVVERHQDNRAACVADLIALLLP